MADNTTLNLGSGGDIIATDDVAGIKFQRVKVTFGDDGSATDVAADNPLPIMAPSALPVTGTFYPATQPVSGAVSISGSVAVTGTFFQATQPVSIAAPVSVTGTFWQATQPVSGTVTANAGTGTFAISAASLPLPAGAATSANQATLNGLLPASLGQKAKAASLAVTIASDDVLLSANSKYATVASAASAQVLGATGAVGDLLSHMVIVPATTSPGVVTITDGAGGAITIFAGGTLSAVVPFEVFLNAKSTSGAWKVTTGSNVSVIAVGSFT